MESRATSAGMVTAAVVGSLSLLWLYRRLRARRCRQQLRGKVVLITGASSGVGEACARAFYRLGCKLILCARRVTELERVKKELMSLKLEHGVTMHAPYVLPLDLEKPEELAAKAREALSLHDGVIDILINNGGISVRGSVLDTQLTLHQKVMTVNHFGSAALTAALLPNMISRRSGHIVAISSVQGKIAIPFRSSYSASKHAMQAFFDCLRAEVAEHNITVSVISPSYVKTNISLNSFTADGSAYGKMDSNIAGGMSAAYLAGRVVEAVAMQQQDVVVGPLTHRAAIFLRTLLPGIYFRVMAARVRSGTKSED